jgi:hypothetical protein
MMDDERRRFGAEMLKQGDADRRELSAQLQRHIWTLLEQTPAVLGDERVPWKYTPHIVVDALSEVMLGIFEPLIAYDPATELASAKHQIQLLRLRLGVLEATTSAETSRPA